MTATPLPPLPEVGYLGDDASYGYDANDMTEYAFAARADLEAEVARLREALEFVARHKSSDWPERCQQMVNVARNALKDQP